MKVAEIYRSVQGEGLLTGVESAFVRASGCNLRCSFCDTPYASWNPEGEDLPVDEVAARVRELECRHAVLTGGEPMLFAELAPLTTELAAAGIHVTIETAGTLDLPVHCDLMSISPKLSNSTPASGEQPVWSGRHERGRHRPHVIQRLLRDYECQFKFVIDRPEDCNEVERYLREFPAIKRDRVMLMPQGVESSVLADRAAWLKPYCEEKGYSFCPRMQIEWFGLTRGT